MPAWTAPDGSRSVQLAASRAPVTDRRAHLEAGGATAGRRARAPVIDTLARLNGVGGCGGGGDGGGASDSALGYPFPAAAVSAGG